MSKHVLDKHGHGYTWGYGVGMCIGVVVHRLKHILRRCTCTHYAT